MVCSLHTGFSVKLVAFSQKVPLLLSNENVLFEKNIGIISDCAEERKTFKQFF